MPGPLDSIGTSVIEELAELGAERGAIRERLELLETRRDTVSEEVYARVRGDYERRLAELDRAAAPLLERARAEYARLRSVLDRLEAEVRQSQLDLEELDLRHELGEFTDEEHASRRRELERALAEQQMRLEEAGKLRDRFVEAAGSEEVLAAPPPSPGTVTAGMAVEAPPPPGPQPEPAPGSTAVVDLPGAAGATVAMASPAADEAAPPEVADATMLIRWPRLELRLPDGSGEELALSGARTRIGTAPDNELVLEGHKVDAHHAEIALGAEGYVIRDLGSKTGVLVNGVVITERTLAEGDEIRIGELTLVFHEP